MKYSRKEIRKADPLPTHCKKATYNSLSEAEEAIEFIRSDRWVKDLSAYRCSICGKWHLTSR